MNNQKIHTLANPARMGHPAESKILRRRRRCDSQAGR
jgi:hypothetical protein